MNVIIGVFVAVSAYAYAFRQMIVSDKRLSLFVKRENAEKESGDTEP